MYNLKYLKNQKIELPDLLKNTLVITIMKYFAKLKYK